MRITNNMLSQGLLRNLESSQSKMYQLQNQLTSGEKISRPSDDPAGTQNIMRLRSSMSSVEQWSSNADSAVTYMNATDSTLGNMTSILQRVRDLAVEGANGAATADDRSFMAIEVDQLLAQLKVTANTQVGSKYIFSGTATDQEYIPSDGSPSQANGLPVNFEVGNGLSVDISVNGQKLFGSTTAAPSGIFTTLEDLSAALKLNDVTAVSSSLESIDANIDNVLAQRAGLGARINRMTAIQNQLETTYTNLDENLSGIQDVNIAQAITEFKSQETVYNAALSVGAKIIQASLVDFL